MPRTWIQGIVVAGVLVGLWPAHGWAQEVKAPLHLIETSATAQEEIAPDSVTLSLEVITQADTVAQARQDNAAKMARLLEVLRVHKWKELVTHTARFAVEPIYEQTGTSYVRTIPKILGYRVSNVLVAKMEGLNKETLAERSAQVLDEGMQHGANQVSGPNMYVKDPEAVQARLLADAVREAKQRAHIMAEAAGVTLGRLHTLRDQAAMALPVFSQEMAVPMMAAEQSVATPIEVGTQTITVTVSLAYEVESL